MSTPASAASERRIDRSWVLNPLLDLPGVRHAVIASRDGLLESASPDLDRAAAERVSAMASSLSASAHAFTQAFTDTDHPVRLAQTVVESELGYAIAVPAGENTCLALFADHDADLGIISYQMQVQVTALSRAMGTPARQPDTTVGTTPET